MVEKKKPHYNLELLKAGIGGWRKIYKGFIEKINPESIVEFGAGRPDFLQSIDCPRKVAIDFKNPFESEFIDAGIEFYAVDLDHDLLPPIGSFDIVICSDVFEHLLYPDVTLHYALTLLNEEGLLFSHVPNEFTFNKTMKIMLGSSESLYFHKYCEEFNDPHLHRFTKIGFEKFLSMHFIYNIYISNLRDKKGAKILRKMGFPIPYAFEPGPTFISTNSEKTFELLINIKKNWR